MEGIIVRELKIWLTSLTCGIYISNVSAFRDSVEIVRLGIDQQVLVLNDVFIKRKAAKVLLISGDPLLSPIQTPCATSNCD